MSGRPNSDIASVKAFRLPMPLPLPLPWIDSAGKISLFRLAVFAAVAAPAL
jgi:hypothetical protein